MGGLRDLTPSVEPTAAMYSFLFLVLGINVGNACSCLCQLRQSCGGGGVRPVADCRLGSYGEARGVPVPVRRWKKCLRVLHIPMLLHMAAALKTNIAAQTNFRSSDKF